MTNVFVKPRIGDDGEPVLVRDPMTGKPLAAAGEWKTQTAFWTRRLRDKDVAEAVPETAPAAPAPAVAPPAPVAPLADTEAT